ncbi:voltage-gated ion channel superfamily [Pelomyxa schiedti]|nr:voltage-gated ion channel superfamily [Pelomyxa schiedti]
MSRTTPPTNQLNHQPQQQQNSSFITPAPAAPPSPPPQFPPISYAAWARGQLLALCVGSCCRRCGLGCPARRLPASLLRDHIGRTWVLRPHTRLAITMLVHSSPAAGGGGGAQDPPADQQQQNTNKNNNGAPVWVQLCVTVGVSHTGGVVDVLSACIPREVMEVQGWAGRGLAVWGSFLGPWGIYDVNNGRGLCSLPPADSLLTLWKFKRGRRWAIMYGQRHYGCNSFVLWPVPEDGSCPQIAIIQVPEGKVMKWLDLLEERDEDEAVVTVQEGRKAGAWCVDLKATYTTGQMVIKYRCRGYSKRNVRRMILLSPAGKLMMATGASPHEQQVSSVQYVFKSLDNRVTVCLCYIKPRKVDSWHFAEFDEVNRKLQVFSTAKILSHSGRVFYVNQGSRFKCGCGCVALWEPGCVDLCDATTGRWLLRQPLPPEYLEEGKSQEKLKQKGGKDIAFTREWLDAKPNRGVWVYVKEIQNARDYVWNTLTDHTFSKLAMFIAVFIVIVIIISTITFIISSEPEYYEDSPKSLMGIEAGCIAVFTLEYLLKVASAPYAGFLLEPMALVDIIVIVPYYVELIIGTSVSQLAVLRVIRLVRIFRVLKIGSYSDTLVVIKITAQRSKSTALLLLNLLFIELTLFSSLMYYMEGLGCEFYDGSWVYKTEYDPSQGKSPFQSIIGTYWWCITTVTTVGYGDNYPKTELGKTVGAITMLGGVVSLAFPIGIFASNFSDVWHEQREVAKKAKEKAEMEKKGKFELLLDELTQQNQTVTEMLQQVVDYTSASELTITVRDLQGSSLADTQPENISRGATVTHAKPESQRNQKNHHKHHHHQKHHNSKHTSHSSSSSYK